MDLLNLISVFIFSPSLVSMIDSSLDSCCSIFWLRVSSNVSTMSLPWICCFSVSLFVSLLSWQFSLQLLQIKYKVCHLSITVLSFATGTSLHCSHTNFMQRLHHIISTFVDSHDGSSHITRYCRT